MPAEQNNESLNWLVRLTLGEEEWPAGDPASMYFLGAVWDELGAGLSRVPAEVGRVNTLLAAAGESPTLSQAEEFLRQVGGGSSLLVALGQAVGEVADGIRVVAVEIEYAQGMIIAFAVMLGMLLLKFVVMAWLTGGVSASGTAAAVRTAQVMAKRIITRLITGVAGGCAMMTSVDVLVQSWQRYISRTRPEWDWEKTKAMAGLGALGGLLHWATGWFKHRFGDRLLLAVGRAAFVESFSEFFYNVFTGKAAFPPWAAMGGAVSGYFEYFTRRWGRNRPPGYWLSTIMQKFNIPSIPQVPEVGAGAATPPSAGPGVPGLGEADAPLRVGSVSITAAAPPDVDSTRAAQVAQSWAAWSQLYGAQRPQPDTVDGPTATEWDRFTADVARADEIARQLPESQRWSVWAGLADAQRAAEQAVWERLPVWNTVMPDTPTSVFDATFTQVTADARSAFLDGMTGVGEGPSIVDAARIDSAEAFDTASIEPTRVDAAATASTGALNGAGAQSGAGALNGAEALNGAGALNGAAALSGTGMPDGTVPAGGDPVVGTLFSAALAAGVTPPPAPGGLVVDVARLHEVAQTLGYGPERARDWAVEGLSQVIEARDALSGETGLPVVLVADPTAATYRTAVPMLLGWMQTPLGEGGRLPDGLARARIRLQEWADELADENVAEPSVRAMNDRLAYLHHTLDAAQADQTLGEAGLASLAEVKAAMTGIAQAGQPVELADLARDLQQRLRRPVGTSGPIVPPPLAPTTAATVNSTVDTQWRGFDLDSVAHQVWRERLATRARLRQQSSDPALEPNDCVSQVSTMLDTFVASGLLARASTTIDDFGIASPPSRTQLAFAAARGLDPRPIVHIGQVADRVPANGFAVVFGGPPNAPTHAVLLVRHPDRGLLVVDTTKEDQADVVRTYDPATPPVGAGELSATVFDRDWRQLDVGEATSSYARALVDPPSRLSAGAEQPGRRRVRFLDDPESHPFLSTGSGTTTETIPLADLPATPASSLPDMTRRSAPPPLDSELQALATGLPEGWALTRSVVGGVVLHRAGVPPAPPRFHRPVGPALTIVVDDSIAELGTATNEQLDRIAKFLATVPGTFGGIVVRFGSLGLGLRIDQRSLVDTTNRLMSGVHQLAFLAVPADHVIASDTVEPQVVPIDNDPQVTFPSLAVEYLVSPLVRPGTALTPYGWNAPAATAAPAVGTSRAPDPTFALPEGWQAVYRGGELSISHPDPGVRTIPEAVQAELGRILRGLPLAHRSRVSVPAFTLDPPDGFVSTGAREHGLPHATIVQPRPDEAELHEMRQSARALPPSGRPLVVVAASMTPRQVADVVANVARGSGTGVDVHVAGLVDHARPHQDFTALADALAGYLPGVMTVQATLVTDRPPDWVRWRPLDAQHAVTFAPWATHFAIHTTDQPEQAPYDLVTIGPNEYELDGWRVTADTTDNHVVVAPAGFTTTATHAGPGGHGRAISVAMPTGNPPFSVQDLVARIAAGQAPNDVDVQRLDDALTETKPAATSEQAPTPVDPRAVPPREALGVSVPRGTLPVEPLVAELRAAFARHGVTEAEWQALPAKLLNNYRYVVSGGFPLKLGRAEVLISLDPKDPIRVTNPGASYDSIVSREEQEPESERLDRAKKDQEKLDRAKKEGKKKEDEKKTVSFHSNQSTQGTFRIGGRGQRESGRTANTHIKLNLAFLFSLVAGAPLPGGFGLGPSLTVNQSNRTSGSVTDAERGRVLDTRASSTLFGYRDPGWRVQFRTDSLAWQEVDLAGMSTGPLVVWVQDHFLGKRPEQVRATGLIEGREQEFPDAYYATPISLTPFYDAVLTRLKDAGVDISVAGGVREELRTKLWNLEVNLDLAINGYARTHPVGGPENLTDLFLDGGYTFTLHDRKTGHVQAAVAVQAQRDNASVNRIGTTSDKAHIEEVRTAISGETTGHTLSSSIGLEVSGFASKPAESEEDGSSPAAFLPSGAVTGTRENKDSISAGGTGLFVLVHRHTGYTVGMLTELLLKAFVEVRGGTERLQTNWEPGQFMLRLTEPDAFEYGFPVDRDAIVDKDRISGRTVPYGPDVVRHKATTGDKSWGRLPDYLTKGPTVGLGAAMVKLSRPEIRRIAKAVADHLRDAGFLPDLDEPFKQDGLPVARDSRLQNLEAFWEAFQPGSFEVHAFQGYFVIEFLLMTGTGEPRRVRLRFYLATDLSNALDRNGNSTYSIVRTDDGQFVILVMGMGLTGRSIEGGTKLEGRFTGNVFDNAGLGGSGSGSLAAAAHVREVGNFPVLIEAMGPHVFHLPSDGETGSGRAGSAPLTVTGYVEYSDERGWTPMTRVVDPTPVSGVLYLLPQLANGSRTTASVPTPTPAWVFDTAGVIYTDATSLGLAAEQVFREHKLAGVGQPGHTAIQAFLSPIAIYSFFSQIVRGAYTTDGPFNPGIVRTTYGGLTVGADVGASAFLGRLGDRPTLGIIELYLKQIRTGAASNWGAGVQLSGLFAGLLRGATADWLDGTSVQAGFADRRQDDRESTGGKEDIKLAFGPLHIFSAPVTYSLDWSVELRGKVGGSSDVDGAKISHESEVVYLLSEADGLAAYGKGAVPLSEEVLNDAMSRWVANELQLTGDVVATVLVRWFTETTDRERMQFQRLQIHAWAEELRARHAARTTVMLDETTVTNFNDTFGFDIDEKNLESPHSGLYIPPNLQGPNPQLGHAAVDRIEWRDQAPDRTPLATARRLIRQIAPGLLTERELLGVPRVGVFYERWFRGRRVIGRLQGGLRTLEILLAGTRLHQLADSLLQPGGTTFYLANQIGYFLENVVALNISASTTPLQYGHYHAETGLETYLHNYRVMATSRAKSFVLDGNASVDPPYAGVSVAGTPGTATGASHTVSRSEQTTEYYTAYDWGGHYDLVGDLLLTFSVRQLGLENKPINNLLAGQIRRQDGHADAQESLPARIVLRLPKALAHAAPVPGPASAPSFTPVVLPPDIFVLSWDVNALPEAERFLQKVFARRTKWGQRLFPEQTYNRRVRPPEAWETQLSRTVLTPKLHTATPDPALPGSDRAGYQLGTVHRPGHLGDRAEVWLSGSVWGPEIIASLPEGTGMGFYGKDSVATTREGSGSRWRFNLGLSTNRVIDGFSGSLHSLSVPGLSTTIGNPLADAASHTVANRPENHVKQQGPVVLVRLRGVFTLKAQRDHTLFLPIDGDMHESDPFSGDIVIEMFADQAQRLLDQLGKQQLAAAASATSTAAPDVPVDAPSFDLVENLAQAAADETATAFNAAGKAASRVMEDIRALARDGTAAEAIVLTANDDARTRLTYLPFIQWARDYLGEVTDWLKANGDTTTVHGAVRAIPTWVDSWNPGEPPSLAEMRSRLRQAYEAVVAADARADQVWSDLGRPARPERRKLPRLVPILGVDPVYAAQQIATETGRVVELRETEEGAAISYYRFDSSGRMWRSIGPDFVQLDPATQDAFAWNGLFTADHLKTRIDLYDVLAQVIERGQTAERALGWLTRRVLRALSGDPTRTGSPTLEMFGELSSVYRAARVWARRQGGRLQTLANAAQHWADSATEDEMRSRVREVFDVLLKPGDPTPRGLTQPGDPSPGELRAMATLLGEPWAVARQLATAIQGTVVMRVPDSDGRTCTARSSRSGEPPERVEGIDLYRELAEVAKGLDDPFITLDQAEAAAKVRLHNGGRNFSPDTLSLVADARSRLLALYHPALDLARQRLTSNPNPRFDDILAWPDGDPDDVALQDRALRLNEYFGALPADTRDPDMARLMLTHRLMKRNPRTFAKELANWLGETVHLHEIIRERDRYTTEFESTADPTADPPEDPAAPIDLYRLVDSLALPGDGDYAPAVQRAVDHLAHGTAYRFVASQPELCYRIAVDRAADLAVRGNAEFDAAVAWRRELATGRLPRLVVLKSRLTWLADRIRLYDDATFVKAINEVPRRIVETLARRRGDVVVVDVETLDGHTNKVEFFGDETAVTT